MIPLQSLELIKAASASSNSSAQHLDPTNSKSGGARYENHVSSCRVGCLYRCSKTICLSICTIYFFLKRHCSGLDEAAAAAASVSQRQMLITISKVRKAIICSLRAAVHRLSQAEQQQDFSTALCCSPSDFFFFI